MSEAGFEIQYSPAVKAAQEMGKPIVALESTIITHGMPFPQNVETALAVEAVIDELGAVPATIAVMEGNLHVGLSTQQLNQLARSESVMKLSRADLAFALSQGQTGSTTVAATMLIAQLSGIAVFATGGIGGVHRGAEESFDISADLSELAASNVIVVCAGAKAILDVEKTLEVLETNGVPVIAYQTDEFPAFWSRKSGLRAPLRMDCVEEIARHARVRKQLDLNGGTLIANPVPKSDEIPQNEIQKHIEKALNDARSSGIAGKEVTPYLLSKMLELTEGKSLSTNIALIKNNAGLAAQIAVALAGK